MTNDEKWMFIDNAISSMRDIDDAFNEVVEPLKLQPESPVYESMWKMNDLLVSSLEALCEDHWGNISWYVAECNYGREPKLAGCPGDMREIDSVEKLRRLCEVECDI